MKACFKNLIIGLLILGCLAVIVWHSVVHLATVQLARPDRRVLQDYHQSWLNSPELHGITVDKRLLGAANSPCLIVEPDGSAQLGKRGKAIRKQLQERGSVQLGDPGEIKAQLVILHGRNGRKEDLLPVAERFCAVGFRCLIPDLPGHGESPIPYAGFGGCESEKDLISHLNRESLKGTQVESLPATILGISMGGAYAIKTVQQNPGWHSMAVVCSFDSLEQVVESQCNNRAKWLGPLLKSSVIKRAQKMTGLDVTGIRSVDWASSIATPVMIVHGAADSLIPIEHGRLLFDAFGSEKKQWLEVPEGGHNNVLITATPVFAPIAEWLLLHLPDQSS